MLNIFYESNRVSHPEWMTYFKYKSKNRSIKGIGQAHLSVPTSEQPSWSLYISPFLFTTKTHKGVALMKRFIFGYNLLSPFCNVTQIREGGDPGANTDAFG